MPLRQFEFILCIVVLDTHRYNIYYTRILIILKQSVNKISIFFLLYILYIMFLVKWPQFIYTVIH